LAGAFLWARRLSPRTPDRSRTPPFKLAITGRKADSEFAIDPEVDPKRWTLLK
jgi:hypothetical protein